MVRRPRLPEDEIGRARSLALQDLEELEDNPSSKAMVELARRYYPPPYNRSTLGERAGLEAVDRRLIGESWERLFRPGGSVLSVAGRVRAGDVFAAAERFFGRWQGGAPSRPEFTAPPEHRSWHIPSAAAQVQIVLAYPSAPFGDPDYYTAKVAAAVLSGGMFGRLFVEVREKRGLCYAIQARHTAAAEYGTVTVYAGTTPERAGETLSVTVHELRTLRGSSAAEEISRAKIDLLSGIVIGEESAAARAGSNAGDWWVGRRVRPLDEIKREINRIDRGDIDRCLERFPADSFMLLTLGASALDMPL